MLPFGNNDDEKAIERIVTIVTPQEAFLAAFSLHPAGVAVITGNLDDGTPAGFTATSLASFSATPPRATGVSQIDANEIGLSILPELRTIDLVAYLRFASVYQAFDSLNDFESAIVVLRAEEESKVDPA